MRAQRRARLLDAGRRRAQARRARTAARRASAARARARAAQARNSRGGASHATAPSSQRDDAVGGGQAALEPVLGEHDRRPPLLVEPPQQPDELVAGDGVELRGRLVEQHEPRPAGERRAERDALQLAAATARASGGRAARAMPSASAASSTPRATAAGAAPRFSSGKRELGAHRPQHDLRLGVLEQRAGDRGEVARPVLARVEPADARRARRTSPPWKCGTSPQAARSSVDLPAAERPASDDELARRRRAARRRAAPAPRRRG